MANPGQMANSGMMGRGKGRKSKRSSSRSSRK